MCGNRLDRVVLFGSRAGGEARSNSSYDVPAFLKDLPARWAEVEALRALTPISLMQTHHGWVFQAGTGVSVISMADTGTLPECAHLRRWLHATQRRPRALRCLPGRGRWQSGDRARAGGGGRLGERHTRRHTKSAGAGHPGAVRVHGEAGDHRAFLGGEREADAAICRRRNLHHLPAVIAAPQQERLGDLLHVRRGEVAILPADRSGRTCAAAASPRPARRDHGASSPSRAAAPARPEAAGPAAPGQPGCPPWRRRWSARPASSEWFFA